MSDEDDDDDDDCAFSIPNGVKSKHVLYSFTPNTFHKFHPSYLHQLTSSPAQ